MEHSFDVVVVSIFGRGHWLAAELIDKGLNVALVEVSEKMGRWAPEDWEGPFGLFRADGFSASQLERLAEDDYVDDVNEGFTLWLKDGPIDFRSPLASFYMDKLGLRGDIENYISKFESLSPSDRETLRDKIRALPFERQMIVHFAQQFACHEFRSNARSLDYGVPLPVFSPLQVRRVTRRGLEKSLNWCETKGVRIFSGADIEDLSISGKQVSGIEIKSSWAGLVRGSQWVWMLSSEETSIFPESVRKGLFPKGCLVSDWTWLRYRLSLNPPDILPLKFILIDDMYLPWVHTNLCVVQQTVNEQAFDVWIRLPTHQRFQRTYLEEEANRIIALLGNKIPNSQPRLVEMPQEYTYDYGQLGPSRFPVFGSGQTSTLKRAALRNVHFDGPEVWFNMDWSGQFRHQGPLSEQLVRWKKSQMQKNRRQEAQP